MGRFVIAAYQPKLGKEARLLTLVKEHLSVLHEQALVTERPAYVMRSSNGAIVEVFEWASADAIERAHSNAAVQALWSQFDEACEYLPLSRLPEAGQVFAEFDAVS